MTVVRRGFSCLAISTPDASIAAVFTLSRVLSLSGRLGLLAFALHLLAALCPAHIPHGNHGNGVINPGARGLQTADNLDGALAFQASADYAQSEAYKRQSFENALFQLVRDSLLLPPVPQIGPDGRILREEDLVPRLEDALAVQGQQPQRRDFNMLSAAERQAALHTLQKQALRPASGITPELLQSNPGFAAQWAADQMDTILNGAPQTTLSSANPFANRTVAGGVGAAAGWDAVGFDPTAGVGPDGATSVGLDPATNYLPVKWGDDSDGDGVGNAEEAALGTDAENPSSRPTNAVLYVHALRRLAEEQALAMQQKRREMLSLLAGHDLALILRSENNWLSQLTGGAYEFNANAPEFFFGDFSRLGGRLDNAGIQGGAAFVSGGAAGALTGAGVGAFFSGVGAGPGALTGGGIGALGGLAEGSVAGFLSSPDMSFEDSLKQGALIGTFNGVLGGASTPLVLRSAGIAAKTGGGVVDDLVTVRSYTDATGKAGISGSGSLRADSWVTLPGEVPSRAGHLQIEKLLEIQPGRGSHFLEFQTPRSNLRVPANGTHTSGGALQFQLNNPTPIDPSTFRRPPGRPAGS